MRMGPNEDQTVYPDQNYCTYQVGPQALHSRRLGHVSLHGKSLAHFDEVYIWLFDYILRVYFFWDYLKG